MIASSGPGRFVVVEGLDGSGKTTLIGGLESELSSAGLDVLTVAGPWDEGIAGADLNAIVRQRSRQAPAEALALAFAVNRTDQSHSTIEPWVRRGPKSVVLSDRHILSGLAYQMLDGLDPDWLLEINRYVLGPDLVLFVDTPPHICAKRLAARQAPRELFEGRFRRTREFFTRAIDLARCDGWVVHLLNGSADEGTVLGEALDAVFETLRRGPGRVPAGQTFGQTNDDGSRRLGPDERPRKARVTGTDADSAAPRRTPGARS